MTRHVWVLLHRYVNLVILVFLVITSLTGSVIAFNSELERVFAPQLFSAPQPNRPKLDLATLAERAGRLVPQARVTEVVMTEVDQASVAFAAAKDAETGRGAELGFSEFFVNPWTGDELGRRRRADLSEGMINLMPFIYELHFSLLAGPTGERLLGIVALVWTLDCFVGFYLALPASRSNFWRRWRQAWRFKRGASVYRFTVDLHRAGGLWLWPLLFVFGWSSVMLELRPVYEAVTGAVFDYESPRTVFLSTARPANETPALDWRAAQAVGERLIAAQAWQSGLTVREPLGLTYIARIGAYYYEVRGSRDLFERAPKGGSTYVIFDGSSGELIKFSMPTGQRAGNTVESWLYALHMTRVFGRPYQTAVCILGLLIAALSVTGILIWLKKRRARRLARHREAMPGA